MLTSAQAGVRSLNMANVSKQIGNTKAFSLILVDQPFISSAIIDKVIDAYTQTDNGIVLPSYNLRRGHPVIFNHKYADAILALDDKSGGVRSLYKTYREDIHYVDVDTDAILQDIDYQEDYDRALKENEKR